MTSTRRFRIVVALDLSEYAEIVLEHAIDQAIQHAAPDLHFVTVVENERALEETKAKLAALVLPALDGCDATNWQARLHVRAGKPANEIACLAADVRAHLIVLGRFGLHHHGRYSSSLASRVIDAASCPTLVVGFGEDAGEIRDQCPDCVEVRARTEGERWFCDAHVSHDRASLASVQISAGSWTGGSLMW